VGMLNDDEKEELKFYKFRLKATLSAFLILFTLSSFMIFAFGHISISTIFIILLLNFIISVIIELFLAGLDYTASSRFWGFFMLYFSLIVFFSIGSFYIGNTYIMKWQIMPNIVMYSLALLLFFVSLFYTLRKRDFIDEAVKEGILDLEQRIFFFFKKDHTPVMKNSANSAVMMGLLSFITPILGASIILILGFDVSVVESKQVIRGVGTIIIFYILIPFTALELARAIQFYQYQKKSSKTIYTGLIKYIRREEEINQWRKQKGLKPLKIKSLFFFGDIDK